MITLKNRPKFRKKKIINRFLAIAICLFTYLLNNLRGFRLGLKTVPKAIKNFQMIAQNTAMMLSTMIKYWKLIQYNIYFLW